MSRLRAVVRYASIANNSAAHQMPRPWSPGPAADFRRWTIDQAHNCWHHI